MKEQESNVEAYKRTVGNLEKVYKGHIRFLHIIFFALLMCFGIMCFSYEAEIRDIIKHFTDQEEAQPIIHPKPVKQQ